MNDLYETLGIARDATAAQVRKAYRALALRHHPDRGGSAVEFQRAHDAYTVLSDPDRRARYDATGDASVKPDNTVAEIMSVLSPCLFGVLKEIVKQGGKISEEDVVHHLRHSIREGAKLMKKSRDDLVRDRESIRASMARFEVTGDEGEPNLLALAARDHIDTVSRQIEQVEKEIARGDKAIEYLKRCRYRADAKKLITQIPGFGGTFTVKSSSSSTW